MANVPEQIQNHQYIEQEYSEYNLPTLNNSASNHNESGMLASNQSLSYIPGADEIRSKNLYDVFMQVNRIVKKKERRKRRLIKEAKRLQKEAEEQVNLLKEIQRIEEEYE